MEQKSGLRPQNIHDHNQSVIKKPKHKTITSALARRRSDLCKLSEVTNWRAMERFQTTARGGSCPQLAFCFCFNPKFLSQKVERAEGQEETCTLDIPPLNPHKNFYPERIRVREETSQARTSFSPILLHNSFHCLFLLIIFLPSAYCLLELLTFNALFSLLAIETNRIL